MTNAMEALEQEKYSLQREVELKGRMLESLRSECEAVKGQQKLLWEQQEAQLERRHTVELNDFRNKTERMKVELEEARLSEKQLRHKLDVQAESLREKAEELRALTERAHETMSTEMLELQVERAELESAKDALQQALQEAHYKEQQLQLSNANLLRQLERLRDEKEEREKEAVSYFNALEKSREANQMLQIQLDQATQLAQDPNSRGNSLFSELEDKRAEMERQLISMKVQHQSLQKQHAFSKQQLHRMKVQIATLMQLQGSRADPGQLERLQSMLSEKNSEMEALMIKLRRLEKVEMMVKTQPSSAPPVEADSNDGTYYTDLLKMQLSNSVKDAERLGDELALQRIKALSESQRVLEMERKLFSAERTLKHCQSDNIKLQVKLDELRLKYEPNDVNKTRIQKRRREKLLVDVLPIGSEPKEEETKTVEMDPSDWLKEEPETEPRPHAAERLPAAPPQPAPPPEPSPQLPRDSKCVRICEDPPVTIPSPPRSPPVDCKIKTEEAEVTVVMGNENRRAERKKQVKSQGAIHVASERTMENQCSQQ
ncbi:protein Spindly [Anguilla rostrata]|uniref:protein Spindly n=1 Tax=Anguilla rostrata TaxID=7938 RepID=UPI0030CD69B5